MKKTVQKLSRFETNHSTRTTLSTPVELKILDDIFKFSRKIQSKNSCTGLYCPSCYSPHLLKIKNAVAHSRAISFVLPAFPGKSPNPNKALGHLPDYAEQLSLQFLGHLCQKVKRYYAPGIKIILCSDGRVFSDIIGMKETEVSEYQRGMHLLIHQLNLSEINLINLEDIYPIFNFNQMRDELMKNHGISLPYLKHLVTNGAHHSASKEEKTMNQMYRGLTRFLFEDSLHPHQTKSRTVLQREARQKAYQVIRRSQAWSELISQEYPDAVRLSIHPQICGSQKLGIRLIHNESWMTPWHGVAVKTPQGYQLMKRHEAESEGARLIYSDNGQPSHYTLLSKEQ